MLVRQNGWGVNRMAQATKGYTGKKAAVKAEAPAEATQVIRRTITNFFRVESHPKQKTHQHVVTDGGFVELYGSSIEVKKGDVGKVLVITPGANGRGLMVKGNYLNVFSEATVSLEEGASYTPLQEPVDVEHEKLYAETTGKPNSRTYNSNGDPSSNLLVALAALKDVDEFLSQTSTINTFRVLTGMGYDQETVRTLLISLMIEARKSGR